MFAPFKCQQSDSVLDEATPPGIRDELNLLHNSYECHEATCLIDGRLHQSSLLVFEGNVLFRMACKAWRLLEAAVFDGINVGSVDTVCVKQQVVDLLILSRCCPDSLEGLKLFKVAVTKWTNLDEIQLGKLASERTLYNEPLIYLYVHMYLDISWLGLTSCTLSIEDVMSDILVLQQVLYKINDYRTFVCPCFKHFFLLLMVYCERNDLQFWELFNRLTLDQEDNFSLWILCSVAHLQGYNIEGVYIGLDCKRVCENHQLLEVKLKRLAASEDIGLLKTLKLVDSLLNRWWVRSAKSDAYQIIWEIIHKRINTFVLNLKTANEIIDFIDTIVYNANAPCSFQYYIYMLTQFLTRFPNQWLKIRGRIYAKLPPHKINDYSEAGLLNITCLYMVLMRDNVKEMTEKLLPLLDNLKPERRYSNLTINVHMCVLILQARAGFSIREGCGPLIQIVQHSVEDRDDFSLIRSYVEGFAAVLQASRDFNLGQDVLLGKWASKYLQHCEIGDLVYFLDVLLVNCKRIRSAGAWNDWQVVFNEDVMGGLKAIAAGTNLPAEVGELAALIDLNPQSQHVLTFTADSISPKIVCQFLITYLEQLANNYPLPKSHEAAILHAWTRCCLLNCENIQKLTANITKISALSNLPLDKTNRNPLVSLIKLLGKSDRELCENCFGVDTWVGSCLTTNESTTLHIYTCISVLFYHCAPLLYHKQKSNCLLSRLINLLLLPSDLLLGKSPHPYVLAGVQRTWHLFAQGIFSLYEEADPYINRTLRDFVVRYIPLLQTNGTPILKCVSNEPLTNAIFNKIGSNFLTQVSRTDSNAIKALQIIKIVLQDAPEVSSIVLNNTLTPILEIVLFHSDKSCALDIVKLVRGKLHVLKGAIVKVTEKHLAFSSTNYFQFANTLVRLVPEVMREVLPDIKRQIVEVEKRRGVGYDNTLRQAYERLVVLLS